MEQLFIYLKKQKQLITTKTTNLIIPRDATVVQKKKLFAKALPFSFLLKLTTYWTFHIRGKEMGALGDAKQ